jgi:hypothetical protein
VVEVVGAVVVEVDVVGLDVVVVGATVVGVDVAAGAAVVVVGCDVGACSLNGTGALGPPTTYTGVPAPTVSKNQSDEFMGMRTQPCDAG